MTTEDPFHRADRGHSDGQSDGDLAQLNKAPDPAMVPGRLRSVPRSLGIGSGGRSDISEHVDEALAEGFGR